MSGIEKHDGSTEKHGVSYRTRQYVFEVDGGKGMQILRRAQDDIGGGIQMTWEAVIQDGKWGSIGCQLGSIK